jgi:cbb3-type cytochrome oxidase maturation protein
MSILYLLVPLAIVLALLATIAFVWSARSGQLDDLVTPALRMLADDDAPRTRHGSASVTDTDESEPTELANDSRTTDKPANS